jgi:hypothetical protein
MLLMRRSVALRPLFDRIASSIERSGCRKYYSPSASVDAIATLHRHGHEEQCRPMGNGARSPLCPIALTLC